MTQAVLEPAVSASREGVFTARAPWWGGDLQTLRNLLVRPKHDLSSWPVERLEFGLADGDRLLASLHRPDSAEHGRPLVLLLHGLSGCEDSTYMRATARYLLSGEWPVLRLNLRGAGPSAPSCRGHYHAGRTEDLREVLRQLARSRPAEVAAGVLCVGFSLGGNMLLKFLGEGESPVVLRGAAAVSAPIDLKAAQVRLMRPRNALYHHYVLVNMRRDFLAGKALRDEVGLEKLMAIKSVLAFDEEVTAPLNGFAGADDYYARCSASKFLGDIGTPTLVVMAGNDPWIPVDSYHAVNWARLPDITLAMPKGGGHVGFHGLGSQIPWHDRRIGAFFERLVGAG